MMRALNTAVMENEFFLWYNAILGEYFVGNQTEYDSSILRYHKDHLNILYTMDVDSYRICDKIRNSLNRARVLVG